MPASSHFFPTLNPPLIPCILTPFLQRQALHGLVDVLELPSMDAISSEYRERLKVELGVIQQQGFAAYFLVTGEVALTHGVTEEAGIPLQNSCTQLVQPAC